MRKKLLAGMLALGLALLVNVAVHADPALNGTWLESSEFTMRLILNNGNWTLQARENITSAWENGMKGTFTARYNTIAFHTTHWHRSILDLATGPEWLDRAAARTFMINTEGFTPAEADEELYEMFGLLMAGRLWGTSALRIEVGIGFGFLGEFAEADELVVFARQ